MTMIEIRRTYRFCSSHCLRREDWDDATNERTYGKSAQQSGHGHNFRLTIILQGTPNSETGQLVDLRVLDAVVNDRVVDVYDHKNLNLDVETLKGKVPCLEVLLEDIWKRLACRVPGDASLVEVQLEIDPFLTGVFRGS
jgi:6-pyruvoyltetrahydropterin/6-carboxytetrahydropterin synthase